MVVVTPAATTLSLINSRLNQVLINVSLSLKVLKKQQPPPHVHEVFFDQFFMISNVFFNYYMSP